MSEQFNEQISEFIDDEMSVEECEFFLRRLQKDESARQRFERYQMIGTVVRGEHVSGLSRSAQAVRADTSVWRYAAGFGIAASVALVSVLGLKGLSGDAALSGDTTGIELTADSAAPPSYVVPDSSVEAQQLVRVPADVRGIQYLFHHTGVTSGLNRTIMHSSVVAGPQDEVTAEDETENLE